MEEERDPFFAMPLQYLKGVGPRRAGHHRPEHQAGVKMSDAELVSSLLQESGQAFSLLLPQRRQLGILAAPLVRAGLIPQPVVV